MRFSPFRLITCIIAVFAMAACAKQGQPPNLGNEIVGIGVIAGEHTVILAASNRIETAYSQGKIDASTYAILRGEESAAATAFNNLGLAILSNQTVTQDQVTAAEQTFLLPLETGLVKYLGPVTLPPAQTQPG